jgi:hypothetical protein
VKMKKLSIYSLVTRALKEIWFLFYTQGDFFFSYAFKKKKKRSRNVHRGFLLIENSRNNKWLYYRVRYCGLWKYSETCPRMPSGLSFSPFRYHIPIWISKLSYEREFLRTKSDRIIYMSREGIWVQAIINPIRAQDFSNRFLFVICYWTTLGSFNISLFSIIISHRLERRYQNYLSTTDCQLLHVPIVKPKPCCKFMCRKSFFIIIVMKKRNHYNCPKM